MLAPRICLLIAEEDLRSWVMDEILLITWVGTPHIQIVEDLEPVDANVIVIDTDHLSESTREELRTRTWTTPVITIGHDDFPNVVALGPGLTSRELKQAIRSSLFAPQTAAG